MFTCLRLKCKPAEKNSFKNIVKEIKAVIEKLDKHIISENLTFNDIKNLLIKAVGLHRTAKDMQGKSDAKSEAGKSKK